MHVLTRAALAAWWMLAAASIHAAPLLAFSAPMSDVRWTLRSGPFECRLEQAIPDFGRVSLIQRGDGQLSFEILVRKGLYQGQAMSLKVRAAPWQPGQAVGHADLASDGGRDGDLVRFGESPARAVMLALRRGHFATLDYTIGDQARIRAEVSSLRFAEALGRLQKCAAGLKPARFADFEKTEVHFASGSARLDARVKRRLTRLAEYLRLFGGQVQIVRTIGNTDNVGTAFANYGLGMRRAEAVAHYLKSQGVTQPIRIASQGEYRPLAANRTARGRALNRRVSVLLIR